ncbi:MAG: hypothetical protein ABI442_04350 [Gemmatimonadaceae bacterium]
MSIYGVGPSTVPRTPLQQPLRDGSRTRAQQTTTPIATTPNRFAPAASPNATQGQQSVPVEAPAGTDPALWSILSSDERSFFAKAGAMGPLTYGRAFEDQRASQLPASRGGRLDVKV